MTKIARVSLSLIAVACVALFGATGCVHRIPIQQGNFLDREDLDRVTVGMTRVQVRALLGTPMIADPFHQERWDYYYYMQMGRWKHPHRRQFTVYFDDQDKVAKIDEPIKAPDIPTPGREGIPAPPEQTADAAE